MRGTNGRVRPAAFGAVPGPPADRGQPPPGTEWPPAEREPEPGEWPYAGEWPGAVQLPPAGGQTPPDIGQVTPGAGYIPPGARRILPYAGQAPPGIWDENPENVLSGDSESRTNPKVAGAPASAGPRTDGRFAAEWTTRGVTVRRNSLLRRRRRAGGGAMVRKATPEDGLRPAEFAADEFADDWAAANGPVATGRVANGPVQTGPVQTGPVPSGTVPGGTGPGGAMPSATKLSGLARRRPPPGGGAGGRWLVWSLRAVLWAVLLVIGFRGVVSIVGSFRQGRAGAGGAPSSAPASEFPTATAEAFALQFGYVYLNFSPGAAAQRAADLTPFIPVGSDPQFGWNGSGSQQLQSEQVASVSVHNAHQATVTLLARVNSGLVELGVPVYAAEGGLVVPAEPALLPAPGRVSPPPAPRMPGDAATRTALSDQLPGFFRAYASGDQQTLARFLAPGAVVTGLGGTVTFGSLNAIQVPAGGATRQIAVTVAWQMPALEPPPAPAPPPVTTRRSKTGAEASPTPSASPTPPPVTPAVEMTYDMTVVRLHGAWYVKAIGPSAEQPGGP
jgi:hypothetical protein